MKKFMSVILTAIMAATMIGSATVTAQAEAIEREAHNVAEVVAFCKECKPGETLVFRPMENVTIWYEWTYTSPQEVEAWLLLLTENEKDELTDVLTSIGAGTEDLSGWHVEESVMRWRTLGL